MQENLISVVVPIYNCQDFLEVCIESICSQTHKNLEIILVDDGSTDDSSKICDRIANQDHRVKVIHKENGGQQDARTVGIKVATGKYIGFVDSDDWIDSLMYEKLLSKIEDNDLITSGIYKYGPEGQIIDIWYDLLEEDIYDFNSEYFTNNLIIHEKYSGGSVVGGISNNLVSKLFRTSIVKKIADKANVYVKDEEDFLFTLLYILNCNKIRVTHDVYYHYRYNSVSTVNTCNFMFLSERTRYYQTIMDALEECSAEEILKNQFQRRFMFGLYSNTARKLDIGIEAQYPIYRYPNEGQIASSKVAIFGAGQVGQSYILLWKRTNLCDVVGWYDNKPKCETILGVTTQNVDSINEAQFEFVICAVLNEKRAKEMRKQLMTLGVADEKICWEPPINIWRNYFLQGENDV